MGVILYDESAFRTISTSLLYHARANPEFRERLREALGGDSSESTRSEGKPPASLPSQCEAFAAVLYHGNRRAAEESHPETDPIPDPVASGAFAPDDVRPEEVGRGGDRPETVVRPARLRELVEGVAYNSDLPDRRTIGVEAAVAHLVLDR
jgi:hypothetical protein